MGIQQTEPKATDDILSQWKTFDHLLKILIIGNSAVGKTSFLARFTDDVFAPGFCSTIGIDFRIKTIHKGDKRIKLQIWDTAGQERYRTITSAYYRGTSGFILMYDITNETSFKDINGWCDQIKAFCYDNTQAVVVGNKCDRNEDRVIMIEDGLELARGLDFPFFEASAKEGINVKVVFDYLVDTILDGELPSREEADEEENKRLKLTSSHLELNSHAKHKNCLC